jgi:hypothetical protein
MKQCWKLSVSLKEPISSLQSGPNGDDRNGNTAGR